MGSGVSEDTFSLQVCAACGAEQESETCRWHGEKTYSIGRGDSLPPEPKPTKSLREFTQTQEFLLEVLSMQGVKPHGCRMPPNEISEARSTACARDMMVFHVMQSEAYWRDESIKEFGKP